MLFMKLYVSNPVVVLNFSPDLQMFVLLTSSVNNNALGTNAKKKIRFLFSQHLGGAEDFLVKTSNRKNQNTEKNKKIWLKS